MPGDEVVGFSRTLEAAIESGLPVVPPPLAWNCRPAWGMAARRRPRESSLVAGAASREARLWRRTMEAWHGADWSQQTRDLEEAEWEAQREETREILAPTVGSYREELPTERGRWHAGRCAASALRGAAARSKGRP